MKINEKFLWVLYFILMFFIFFFLLIGLSDISVYLFCLILFLVIIFAVENAREDRSVFLYYFIDVPLFLVFIGISTLWFILPVLFYFSKPGSIYYTICLPFFGGLLGKVFWVSLYLIGWGYVGLKVLNYFEKNLIQSSYFLQRILKKFRK